MNTNQIIILVLAVLLIALYYFFRRKKEDSVYDTLEALHNDMKKTVEDIDNGTFETRKKTKVLRVVFTPGGYICQMEDNWLVPNVECIDEHGSIYKIEQTKSIDIYYNKAIIDTVHYAKIYPTPKEGRYLTIKH